MGNSAEGKVVLLLTEGETDITALASCFQNLVDERARIQGLPFRCDVTIATLFPDDAAFKVHENVRETVRDCVLQYLGKGHHVRGYGWKDLAAIIHVVDTDGCFIPNSCIVEDASLERIQYDEDRIIAVNRYEIENRNNVKAESLKRLVNTHFLTWNRASVPYGVYFVSRNLEHALADVSASLSDDEKERLAQAFRRKYANDAEAFLELVDGLAIDKVHTHKQSWRALRENTQSLKRCSNLNLATKKLVDIDYEER